MKLSDIHEARYYKPSSSFAAFVVNALQILNAGDEPRCLDKKDKVPITTLGSALEQLEDAFGPAKKTQDNQQNYVDYQWVLGKYYVELFSYGMVDGERYVGLCVSPDDNVNV